MPILSFSAAFASAWFMAWDAGWPPVIPVIIIGASSFLPKNSVSRLISSLSIHGIAL